MPRLIQVIEAEATRGRGRDADDPVRRVTEYYTIDGDFLAMNDPMLSFDGLLDLVSRTLKPEDRQRFFKALGEEPLL